MKFLIANPDQAAHQIQHGTRSSQMVVAYVLQGLEYSFMVKSCYIDSPVGEPQRPYLVYSATPDGERLVRDHESMESLAVRTGPRQDG